MNMFKARLIAGFCVPGKYVKTAACLPVSNRDSEQFRHGNRRCHTRHQLKWDIFFLKCQHFLAATSKDKRIAALQAHDTVKPFGGIN